MSIVTPAGFAAAGHAAGIKPSGALDLALVATADARPVPMAAVFTTNLAAAPPVEVSRAHLAANGGVGVGVVVSSGNANAATGDPGRANAERMCALSGEGLGCAPEALLVCSTGLIGFQLPMDVVEPGIRALVDARGSDDAAGLAAATGILTTDSGPKEHLVTGDGWSVAGIAKGAGMLAPNMATMLAVLTTDADVAPVELDRLLRAAVAPTFNSMTVDGCTSTNDTVAVLASGRAGRVDAAALLAAMTEVCRSLATQMARDAEGASRLAHVVVTGAASDADAHAAARKVAESQLVKCSLLGGDPYWGRIVSELGSAGVAFEIDRVSVAYGGTTVCRGGVAVDHDAAAVRAHMAGTAVELSADLGVGTGTGAVTTVDLGYGYLDENKATS